MTSKQSRLANAIDNHNLAHEAMNCCSPDMKDRFTELAGEQHSKFVKAAGLEDYARKEPGQ